MAKLELRNVRKSYGTADVITGLDLEVQSGEFCVFVGPSGCGKSTLLRMIAGLEEITSGEVVIDGEVVNAISAARRGLAMVFQSYALYPHMSVRANLSFGLENLRMEKDEVARRVDDAARMLQIEDYMNRRPGQLSGGQRQRVAIGRAVVREPRIFLFDEPLSNLDAELRVTMRGEISGLHARLGNTMIYVTHDQIEAMTMADKIAVIRSGRLEQFGTPLDLYNAPENLFVAGFIGSPRMNMFEAEVDRADGGFSVRLKDGTRFEVPQALFDVPSTPSVTLGLRPGDMKLTDGPGIRVAVSGVEQHGSESFVFGKTPSDEAVVFGTKGQTSVQRGASICLTPEPDCFHLFSTSSGKSLRSASTSTTG